MKEKETRPAGFGFFSGLCIFLGAFGILGNTTLLTLGVVYASSAVVQQIVPAAWLLALHLFTDAGFLLGGIKVRKRAAWARRLVVACAFISLLEFWQGAFSAISSQNVEWSTPRLLAMATVMVMWTSIAVYFSQKKIADYIIHGAVRSDTSKLPSDVDEGNGLPPRCV